MQYFSHKVLCLTAAFFLSTVPLSAYAADVWQAILRQAGELHGDDGLQAAAFLAMHRPDRDSAIDPELVLENIALALEARVHFPWARGVPLDLFHNDVLPYAVLDEPRARTRKRLLELSRPIVEGAANAADAAQRLNRDLFNKVGVRYSTARDRANQNARETIESGTASCTGLSIVLIEACRSVGIPARMAGIASWPGRGGNHAWVEIHDGQNWRFLGAAEYDASGLDHAWFTDRAAGSVPGHTIHGVWATSWRGTGRHFPLVWNMDDRTVPGVDITERYTRPSQPSAEPVFAVRLWASRSGHRARAEITLGEHTDTTHADQDDINLVAELPDTGDRPVRLSVRREGVLRIATIDAETDTSQVMNLFWNELAMSKDDAAEAARAQWASHVQSVQAELAAELEAMKITHGEFELPLLLERFGVPPVTGPSLWISMHGGGGAPPDVNDRQWRNQIHLYQPDEGIYIAPRAPSNTWNMWHRPEVDALVDKLIESAIVVWGVDPNRIYLMGYSAGGDGVYQLAPRMADRFAAASMMAGHPNNAQPEGLRNLPFAILMGSEDSAFDRNKVAHQWSERLADLRAHDPGGYSHFVRIYPGLAHWMERRDAEALPWMAKHTRNPWPDRVIWQQGNTPHLRFYWLAVPHAVALHGGSVHASVSGQTIAVESQSVAEIDLLLNDSLLDLDSPITVIANERTVFEGIVPRTEQAIRESIRLRPDPAMIATAILRIRLNE